MSSTLCAHFWSPPHPHSVRLDAGYRLMNTIRAWELKADTHIINKYFLFIFLTVIFHMKKFTDRRGKENKITKSARWCWYEGRDEMEDI